VTKHADYENEIGPSRPFKNLKLLRKDSERSSAPPGANPEGLPADETFNWFIFNAI
jgi:hypothetical protein